MLNQKPAPQKATVILPGGGLFRNWIVNPHRSAKTGGAIKRRQWKRRRASGRR